MRHGRWWKIALVGLVFAVGLASGLFIRRGMNAADVEFVLSVKNPHPLDPSNADSVASLADPRMDFPIAPEPLRADPHNAPHVSEVVVPSLDAPLPPSPYGPIGPPEMGAELTQIADSFAPIVPHDGPELHPPDAPTRRPDETTIPDSALPRTAEKDDMPERLPLPAGVAPVPNTESERRDAHLRALIEQELPEASPQEQEVWLEELRGTNPSTARQLLELRRRLGSTRDHQPSRMPDVGHRPNIPKMARRPGSLLPDWPSADEEENLPPEPVETNPLTDSRVVSQPLENTMLAMRQARAVILNNLANAHTDGFRRAVVEFGEGPYFRVRESGPEDDGGDDSPDAVFGRGAVLRTRIEFHSGEIRETGRPLDVAIDGDGWLKLQVNERVYYTRCGKLVLDRTGKLAVRVPGQTLSLEPAVVIPRSAKGIEIDENGNVRCALPDSEDEGTVVGRIHLAKLLTDDALVPCGNCLFKAAGEFVTAHSAAPGSSGLGMLKSRCLEASNVDVDSELYELQRIQEQSQTLIHAMRLMRDHDDGEPTGFSHLPGSAHRCSGCEACPDCSDEGCEHCPDGCSHCRGSCSDRSCKGACEERRCPCDAKPAR